MPNGADILKGYNGPLLNPLPRRPRYFGSRSTIPRLSISVPLGQFGLGILLIAQLSGQRYS